MAFAIVEEELVGLAILETVAIDVRENSAAIIFVRKIEPGLVRDILELPAAQVLEERIRSVEAAEKKIDEAVAIEIAGRHTRAIEQHAIGRSLPFDECIREEHSYLFRLEEREP